MNLKIRTDAHFVISNFNTEPEDLLQYCETYTIYEQSTSEEVRNSVLGLRASSIRIVNNSGHNLTNFFTFFVDNWGNLPETMVLLKGNIIGRHLSREYFERVIGNKHYTFLWEDSNYKPDQVISSVLYESGFLELNNSWYSNAKVRRYFSNYDQFLSFFFVDPVIPKWILFAPGGCYILPRTHIERYPRAIFETLHYLSSYRHFPGEAYFIERFLHTLFCANYPLQPYIYDFEKTLIELENLRDCSYDLPDKLSFLDRIKHQIVKRIRL